MLNSIYDNITPIWIIFQIAIINILCVPFILGIKLNKEGSVRYTGANYSPNILIFGCVIFCTFASFDGDFFHYRKIIGYMLSRNDFITHMEPPYVLLVTYITESSYFLFRVIIWGLALCIYRGTYKILGLNTSLIWIVFIISTIVNVAFIRGFLAYAIFFYGYIIYNKHPIKLHLRIIGVIAMISSILFHKSMIVLIVLGIFSLFKFRKYYLYLYVCAIPLGVIFLENFFLPKIGLLGRDWVGENTDSFGIGYNLFNYLSYIIVFVLLWQLAPRNRIQKNDTIIEKCWHICILVLVMFIIVLIFSIKNKVGGMYFANRIFLLVYCFIPYLLYTQLMNRKKGFINILLISVSILATNYRLLYAYYLQSIGVGI